ncbi:glycine-rich domain-containing protein [Streptomyces sp. SudanB182_2057]|uniref:glycine-rich domain-containing protein n=1 Tax=Streptomyces sp. SudanB182_2057 TaxID=3035281 RepID=UPI003F56F7DD
MTVPPGPTPDGGPVDPKPPKVFARTLITDEQFTSCRQTVMDANPDMSPEIAGRIVEEGLKFVAACAKNPDIGLAPSRIVDEGWHALLLHTSTYADLCERLGGRFIHHYPGYDPTNYDPPILNRTREKIAELGWEADPELWGPPEDETLVSVVAKCQHAPSCTIRPMPKPEWP